MIYVTTFRLSPHDRETHPGHAATAVIMSVCGAAPFNGVKDQTLAVAYISAFLLVFLVINLTFFMVLFPNFFLKILGDIIPYGWPPLDS